MHKIQSECSVIQHAQIESCEEITIVVPGVVTSATLQKISTEITFTMPILEQNYVIRLEKTRFPCTHFKCYDFGEP